jgi:hypothetical protein
MGQRLCRADRSELRSPRAQANTANHGSPYRVGSPVRRLIRA